MRARLLALCLMLLPGISSASPPPPPPEYIADAATTLSADLTPQNFGAYSAYFADDLHVFLDDRLVASNRTLWLAQEKGHLGKVERNVVGYAEGPDNILLIDQYDDRSGLPDRPGLLFDPRFITRAARYQFGQDHLIHEVRFVQGGGFWISQRRGS